MGSSVEGYILSELGMGLVRLLLALLVLDFHSRGAGIESLSPWPTYMPNSYSAVQAFYVISGFYMSLVLTGKYAKYPVWTFYRARLLRLLPIYWLVATATLLYLIIVRSSIIEEFLAATRTNWWLGPWMIFSNLTMIGQDWNWFILSDFGPLSRYNVVSVAWTLGVELTFYAIVPALVALRTRWIIFILIGSVMFRLIGAAKFGVNDPWGARVFLFDLAWFAWGLLAHRFYAVGYDGRTKFAWAVSSFFVLSLCWWAGLHVNWLVGERVFGLSTALPYATALALPFIFELTKDSKLDASIGEFSYPVYLVHSLVISVLIYIAPGHQGRFTVLAVSLLISAVILFFLRPIERMRQRSSRLSVNAIHG